MAPPLWASWMVSPRTSNSSGGDPVRPLWCHWVKTCQVFGAGKSLANIVLHAYHLSFPSTSLYCADEFSTRSEEHTSELQSPYELVCRLLLEKKNSNYRNPVRQNC